MKRIGIIFLLFLLAGCSTSVDKTDWGSFTSKDAYSYDKAYIAKQEIELDESTQIKNVQIRIESGTEHIIWSLPPFRARDFWEICWEKDSNNLWIQSGDVGVICFNYDEFR